MFDDLKRWWKNQQQLSQLKSEALRAEKALTIKEEAKLDNSIRLQRKKNYLMRLKNQKQGSPTLSLFGSKSNATKKNTSGGLNPSGSILNKEI